MEYLGLSRVIVITGYDHTEYTEKLCIKHYRHGEYIHPV